MTTYLTVEFAPSYGVSLQTARRLTDNEKKGYLPEYQDHMMISMGDSIDLPNVTWPDLAGVIGDRQIDGEFPGCGNRVYIITKEQWDALVALDGGHTEQARDKEIADLETAKAKAESQMVNGTLPRKAEAQKMARDYNNVHNEGGYGYVPHYYTDDEYACICARLNALKEGN